MTRAAIETGLYVTGWFTGSRHSVVTACTRARHLRVIEAAGGRPCGGAVAITAVVVAQYMICRLGTGEHTRARGMTAHTRGRRTFEYTINVAGFTAHLPMLTIQIKPCGQVIELAHHIYIGCSARLRSLRLRHINLQPTQQHQAAQQE